MGLTRRRRAETTGIFLANMIMASEMIEPSRGLTEEMAQTGSRIKAKRRGSPHVSNPGYSGSRAWNPQVLSLDISEVSSSPRVSSSLATGEERSAERGEEVSARLLALSTALRACFAVRVVVAAALLGALLTRCVTRFDLGPEHRGVVAVDPPQERGGRCADSGAVEACADTIDHPRGVLVQARVAASVAAHDAGEALLEAREQLVEMGRGRGMVSKDSF